MSNLGFKPQPKLSYTKFATAWVLMWIYESLSVRAPFCGCCRPLKEQLTAYSIAVVLSS
jgi:hypothetical protein